MIAEEDEPNPVTQIVVTRTVQAVSVALPVLIALQHRIGAERMRRVWPAVGVTATAGLSAYFVATFCPRTRFPGGRLIARLPKIASAPKVIALTFDDGPFPETTARLLAVLAEGGAKATFFLVGERAAAQPELVRRIMREGHAIGIHGLRHRTMALMAERQIRRDLTEARQIVEDILGNPLPTLLFRPPYGFQSATLARTAAKDGWTTVAWSYDCRDYDRAVTADVLVARFKRATRPPDIVLLHERPDGQRNVSIEALPDLLRYCRERGWICRALDSTTLS